MDGYTYRPYIAINGQFPGPSLVVNYNQTLMINVTNLLDQETISVHWHGLNQRGTNWMDGVYGITQCGISPGNTFTYIFQADPSGTFWYHSHVGTQRDDGLFGALIIKEPDEIIDIIKEQLSIDFVDMPEDHTITLLDWQQSSAGSIYSAVLGNPPYFYTDTLTGSTGYRIDRPLHFLDTEGSPIPYWSGLINGKGKHPIIDYSRTHLKIFTISPSGVYRFRIIGSQATFAFMMSIDGHVMNIIATDGYFIEPVETTYLIVHSGERYDVLIKGKNQSELDGVGSNFMIRAVTLESIQTDNFNETLTLRLDHTAEAILHYDISPQPYPMQYEDIAKYSKPSNCTVDDPCAAVNCPFKSFPPIYNITCVHMHQLALLIPPSADELPKAIPDESVFLNFAFEGHDGTTSSVNARSFKLPKSPYSLLNSSEFKGQEFCQDLDDPSICDRVAIDADIFPATCLCSQVRTVSFNQTVQLVLSAVGSSEMQTFYSSHPIHLHGHHFHVADIQFGIYDDATGRLIGSNTDIDCGGSLYCTTPHWKSGNNFLTHNKLKPTSILKDTLLIPAGGYAVVYIKTDNPGHWFLHCHTNHHLAGGMAIVLSEAVELITQAPSNIPTCHDFSYSLNEYFNSTSDHHVDVITGSANVCFPVSLSVIFLLLLICTVMMAGLVVMSCSVLYKRYFKVAVKSWQVPSYNELKDHETSTST
jgi:FtsP/CotA-like multicopper oxidase with cupredoxin domain